MQERHLIPGLVVLGHTLQAVAEVFVGGLKFTGRGPRCIELQEVDGGNATWRTPTACAHSEPTFRKDGKDEGKKQSNTSGPFCVNGYAPA